jgi:hypothetical protein
MFKLPALPSPRADVHELADFAELLAWRSDSVSVREILAYLGRTGDNEYNEGVDDEDDINADALDDVMIEIDRRSKSCVGGYPFMLDLRGTVLRHDPSDSSERADVYRYLLLSTRLNMTADKVQANIDGTGLLEEISATVLRCYLGYDRAKSVVFGTAIGGTFRKKVDALCGALGEGGCFEPLDPGPVNANDDRLDSVAWIPFSDSRGGKLIIFCQCKTGSSWKEHTTQLQPDVFIRRWMKHRTFLVVPVRAFCVSESACPTDWGGLVSYAGLLFDRLRLVDFLDHIEPDLLERIRTWNQAASAVAVKAMG